MPAAGCEPVAAHWFGALPLPGGQCGENLIQARPPAAGTPSAAHDTPRTRGRGPSRPKVGRTARDQRFRSPESSYCKAAKRPHLLSYGPLRLLVVRICARWLGGAFYAAKRFLSNSKKSRRYAFTIP